MEMRITRKSRIIIHEKERKMTKIPNIHPGEILVEEFLKPMKITAYRLSKGTNIDQTRISEIIRMKRSISVDTALRFAKFFGNSPEFWINIQNHYDIEAKKREMEKDLKKIKQFVPQLQNV
jgi:addiction module HigA family antidote